MKKINFSHYFRLHTRQKYFIWNNLDSNFPENPDFDEENFENTVWNFEALSENPTDFSELHINIFKNFTAEFHTFIKKKYPEKKICIVYPAEVEKKIAQTISFYKSGNCDIMFNPCFEYKDAVAHSSVFFVFNKKLSILKLSTSTKIKDYLAANWNFWITTYALRGFGNDLNPIEEVSYFLIDTVENPRKNQTEFCETLWVSTNKGVKSVSKIDREGPYYFFAKKIAKQNGLTLLEFNNPYFLEQNRLVKNLLRNTVSRNSPKQPKKTKKIIKMIPIIDALSEIKEAKNIKTFSPPQISDNGNFEKNPDFNMLMTKFYPQLANISGTLLKAKDALSLIEDEEKLLTLEKNSFWFNFFQENNSIIINQIEELKKFLLNLYAKKIVWYDFEAFSLPFPPIDYVQPFQQIVSQVSIVLTNRGQILNQNFSDRNLVFDPKNYTWENFFLIIDKIYHKHADFYVVFNKSYELTRLKEMLEIIFKNYLERLPYHKAKQKLEEYELKVAEIIKKTIDLKDPFAKYWLVISDLKGCYSIKKIENFITKYKYNLKRLIIPYKQLAIKNGLEAMIESIDRYFNFIGDNQWEITRKNLQIYCQNDVIAMIMVWDFLKFIYKNANNASNIKVIKPQKVTLFDN